MKSLQPARQLIRGVRLARLYPLLFVEDDVMSRRPPGPTDWLFGFGNVYRLRNDPLQFILDSGRTYGDIVSFRLPLPPFRLYLVNNPDLIHEVLIAKGKSFRKLAEHTRVLKQFAGNGLVASEGDFWLRQRRLVQPAFHARRMSRYAQVVVDHTRRMLERWRSGTEVNMPHEMRQLTAEIIVKALFDAELTGNAGRLTEARRADRKSVV